MTLRLRFLSFFLSFFSFFFNNKTANFFLQQNKTKRYGTESRRHEHPGVKLQLRKGVWECNEQLGQECPHGGASMPQHGVLCALGVDVLSGGLWSAWQRPNQR